MQSSARAHAPAPSSRTRATSKIYPVHYATSGGRFCISPSESDALPRPLRPELNVRFLAAALLAGLAALALDGVRPGTQPGDEVKAPEALADMHGRNCTPIVVKASNRKGNIPSAIWPRPLRKPRGAALQSRSSEVGERERAYTAMRSAQVFCARPCRQFARVGGVPWPSQTKAGLGGDA